MALLPSTNFANTTGISAAQSTPMKNFVLSWILLGDLMNEIHKNLKNKITNR